MILDGRKLATEIVTDLRNQVAALPIVPRLSIILVGDNPSSLSYVRQKERFCELAGIEFDLRRYPVEISEESLTEEVRKLNKDPKTSGFIVQLPLPAHINGDRVIAEIDPNKDVDGFTVVNMGRLTLGDTTGLIPCTPKGVMHLLEANTVDIRGKNVVMIGKSNIVGKPLALLLSNAGGTVTICHKDTRDLSEFTKNADIIVVAAWKPGLLRADMVRPGVTIVDVGFTVVDGKIYGDADFTNLEPIATITPVPGGVGPMTVAMLMENTYIAARDQQILHSYSENVSRASLPL